MFADAYEKAAQFTYPLIVLTRRFDGKVQSSLGAFVVLNSDGWIATAAHLLEAEVLYQKHSIEVAAYRQEIEGIESDERLRPTQQAKRKRRFKSNPEWIINHSFVWGRGDIRVTEAKTIPEADLAVARLEGFDPTTVTAYPVIKSPSRLRCGTSLCRLGFPFDTIEATYDEETNSFTLPPEEWAVTRFPIEGIYTRDVLLVENSKESRCPAKFLETSSPGLRGQSGGPIFDSKGTVWAIQSRTMHFPLGFSPKVKKDGREVEENQFLNVGWGVHPEVLVAFLEDNKIEFQLSDY
jgi:hypothetical protein